MLQACLVGDLDVHEVTVGATNRRGKTIECAVTATPMRADGGIEGIVLLMAEREV